MRQKFNEKTDADAIAEMMRYEMAAQLGKTDPHTAHAMIIEQGADPEFEPVYPTVRVTVMADLVRRMKVVEGIEVTRDLARVAAFRADPGSYLPGAERSSVCFLHAPRFDMLVFDGKDMPWTYTAAGRVRSDYIELCRVVEDGLFAGGILIGPPEAEGEVLMPDNYRFAPVEISTGGRVAL